MGRRDKKCVLVVEDEPIIGFDIETVLTTRGYSVLGPCGSVEAALGALDSYTPDAAVLDITLGVESSIKVADHLMRRNVPFLWLTGHGDTMVPEDYRLQPLIRKPFVNEALIDQLEAMIGE